MKVTETTPKPVARTFNVVMDEYDVKTLIGVLSGRTSVHSRQDGTDAYREFHIFSALDEALKKGN